MRKLENCPECGAKLVQETDEELGLTLLMCPKGCGCQDTIEYEWTSYTEDEDDE